MIRSPHLAIVTSLFIVLLLALPRGGSANESIGIDAKIGTMGVGAEISAALIPNTRIRGGVNFLSGFSYDTEIADINYDFEPDFNSISVLFDVHPFGGAFFLSGGVYFNNNTVGVEGSLLEGDVPAEFAFFSSIADLTSITGEVEFSPVAPYAGLGWRTNSGASGWGFSLELGVLFQGEPDVTNLRINGPIDVNDIAEVQEFLAEQEREIEDELSIFQFYPVVAAMLTYHF